MTRTPLFRAVLSTVVFMILMAGYEAFSKEPFDLVETLVRGLIYLVVWYVMERYILPRFERNSR